MKPKPQDRRSIATRWWLPLFLAYAIAGVSCQSLLPPKVSTTPDELRPGCRKSTVRLAMGRPAEVHSWKSGDSTIGEIWFYDDYWWSRERRSGQNFGSWSVYIDGRGRFVGWRLNSPAHQNPNSREVFYGVNRRARTSVSPTMAA